MSADAPSTPPGTPVTISAEVSIAGDVVAAAERDLVVISELYGEAIYIPRPDPRANGLRVVRWTEFGAVEGIQLTDGRLFAHGMMLPAEVSE